MGETVYKYKRLVGSPHGNNTHSRHSHKQTDNIKLNLREMVNEDLNWTEVT